MTNAQHTPVIKSVFMPTLTFDGHGLNNASDEYKGRVATFYGEYKNIKGFGDKIALAYNCHDELLEALEKTYLQLQAAWKRQHYAEIADAMHTVRDAIAKATGK